MTAIKKLMSALLCLCTLLLCACAGEVSEPDEQHQLKLWYVESAPMAENLVQLAEEFNGTHSGYKVVPRAFDSEQKLAAAFDSGHPDLLLCGHERAFALYEQDKLTDLSAALGDGAPEFLSGVDIYSLSVGRSYFPLGAQTQLLYVNGAAFDASKTGAGVGSAAFGTIEALCSIATAYGRSTGEPFMTADSFADIFYNCMLQHGEEFTGDAELDMQSEEYKALYNLLADAAYNHGLRALDGNAARLVEQGGVICALVHSSKLGGELPEGMRVYAFPGVDGGEDMCSAELFGLAVTTRASEKLGGAAEFIKWLCAPARYTAAALDGGCIPLISGASYTGDSALAQALMDIYGGKRLYLASASSGYYKNRDEFDRSFAAALELFY